MDTTSPALTCKNLYQIQKNNEQPLSDAKILTQTAKTVLLGKKFTPPSLFFSPFKVGVG